jgi:hypothetical protein
VLAGDLNLFQIEQKGHYNGPEEEKGGRAMRKDQKGRQQPLEF